jgi:hypothetical protein
MTVTVTDALGTGFPPTALSATTASDANGIFFTVPVDPSLMPGPKLISAVVATSPGPSTASNALALMLLPDITDVSPLNGGFDGSTAVTITGTLLAQVATGTDPQNPLLTPTVLFGSYAIPAANVTVITGPPMQLTVTMPPASTYPNPPQSGQALPVRVRVNGAESRCWTLDSLGRPQLDPSKVFTVS